MIALATGFDLYGTIGLAIVTAGLFWYNARTIRKARQQSNLGCLRRADRQMNR